MSDHSLLLEFDNPRATYTVGQNVTGKITLELLTKKRFQGILLKLLGKAKLQWEAEHYDIDEEPVILTARETYISHSEYIFGDSGMDVTLPAGRHSYSFSLLLPRDLPSSFHSVFGRVRYSVRIILCCPQKADCKYKATINVLNPLDLNNYPSLRDLAQTTKEKTLWCFCCASSPVTITVTVPFTGYKPGQTLEGFVEIDNISSRKMKVISSLIQKIKFTMSKKNTLRTKNAVAIKKIGYVNPHASMMSSFRLKLPDSLPDSTQLTQYKCKYIDVLYYIEIAGYFSQWHFPMFARLPIIVGSIALKPRPLDNLQESQTVFDPDQTTEEVFFNSTTNLLKMK